MIEETKSMTIVAFEAAMQRCADEAGREASLAQDLDGEYQQPEMRRALAGWLGAASLIAEQVRGFVDIGVSQFRADPAFQSGFLQFLEQAIDLLDLPSNALGSSPVADVTASNTVTSAAAFDDAALLGFNRAMKAKMALGRAQGRGGWWSAPVDDLSAMLRTHVDKGDPLDVGVLAMMHWYKDAAVAPALVPTAGIVAAGELTKISSSPVMGGQLDIRTTGGPIGITGFPNELARGCKPLLWEQVEIVIRATNAARSAAVAMPESASPEPTSFEWLAAARAAFQAGVDLDTVMAWAAADEIDYRNDGGTIMVRCASLLARSHQHRIERIAGATPTGGKTASEGLARGAAASTEV